MTALDSTNATSHEYPAKKNKWDTNNAAADTSPKYDMSDCNLLEIKYTLSIDESKSAHSGGDSCRWSQGNFYPN